MKFVDVPAIFSGTVKSLEVYLLPINLQKSSLDLFKVFLFVWNLALKGEWCNLFLFFFKLRMIQFPTCRHHLHLYHIFVGIFSSTQLGFKNVYFFL